MEDVEGRVLEVMLRSPFGLLQQLLEAIGFAGFTMKQVPLLTPEVNIAAQFLGIYSLVRHA